ncbi:MAG TPA: SGNH/GDSL hydrolase family protein [Candidatus Acidoferrum sp.]|nr:SGNH/GDSL hydrolase family protein [Candidatus Acidoferrum sp.]
MKSIAFNPATSLFVVWGGANDFFINPSAATAAAAVTNLSGELTQLYGVGARNFLVPNMVDLSLTPYGLVCRRPSRSGCTTSAKASTQAWHPLLACCRCFPA